MKTEMTKIQMEIPKKQVTDFCHRWKITEFALFGSVLRDDFKSDSDVDVLVSFASDARWSLFDLVRMQDELKNIFGHDVDLIERIGLRNPIRRKAIVNSMEIIYGSS